jgi:hypothetical protein
MEQKKYPAEQGDNLHMRENIYKVYIWQGSTVIPRIYKELQWLNSKNPNNLKKWAKEPDRHLSKEDMNGQKVLEKTFSIASHQGNKN